MKLTDVKPNLNKLVKYRGSTYTLSGCIIRKDKSGNFVYSAEITDKNNNSVAIVRLEEVQTNVKT